MKQMKEGDFKLFVEEFKKGNNTHLLRNKYNNKNEIFSIVKDIFISRRKIEYNDYDISDNSFNLIANGKSSIFSSWNWDTMDFFILTKKEAQPFMKELIIKNLTESK